ncbi:MAG: nucleotidyltransferase family protein [Firmicutes bacterium]|nr:nucleotidyltransferase family protein [Bacillota bacterium]
MKKVKVAAVIAEFNPLHDGHRFIIHQARVRSGASHVMIIQSGNLTQRAEPAIEEKHLRAEKAIKAGADAVVEIPVAYATGNAEVFAKAGVKIATSFAHVTHLVFGIESEDLSLLRLIAQTQVKRKADFEKYMTNHIKKGISFDKARCEVIKKLLPQISAELIDKSMNTPNNILALEYLKELVRLESKVKPIGVQRIPAINSSAIRRELEFEQSDMYRAFGSLVLYSAMSRMDEDTYNSNTELINLFKNKRPVSYDELKRETPTKRFSVSRIVRLALHSTLTITKKDVEFLYKHDWVPYTTLLAINMDAGDLFSAMCLNFKTPLLVRGNKVKPEKNAYYKALRKIDKRAELLYEAITGIRTNNRPSFVMREDQLKLEV